MAFDLGLDMQLSSGSGGGGGGGYTGPLDIVSGPLVAYGQRALSAAKRGSALYTIRESSGNTTQSFNSDATTGAAPVSAINTFLNGANGFATLWKDQSGNGNDVAQATAANQPQWLSSFTGGSLPGLDFGIGGVHILTTAGNIVIANGNYTCFAACLMKDNLHGDELCGIGYESGTGPGWFAWEFTVTTNVHNYQYFIDIADTGGTHELAFNQRTATPSDSGIAHNTAVLYDAKLQGNTDNTGQEIRLNNAVQALPTFAAVGPIGSITGPFNIGSDDTLANSAESFYGQVMELIIYDSILSDAHRLSIRQNIASYYGITLS